MAAQRRSWTSMMSSAVRSRSRWKLEAGMTALLQQAREGPWSDSVAHGAGLHRRLGVQHHVHARHLAALQRALERGADPLRLGDVLPVAAEGLHDLVVPGGAQERGR